MSNKGTQFLKQYYQSYWQRIEEARKFVPHKYLPADLRSVRKVVIGECIDGYLILMYAADKLEIQSFKTSRTTRDVCATTNLHRLRDSQGRLLGKQAVFTIKMEGDGSLVVADPQVRVELKTGDTIIFRPPWLRAHVIINKEPQDCLRVDPVKDAEHDVQTLVFARILQVDTSVDIAEMREKVIAKLEDLLIRFNAIMEDASREQELQDFIKQNSFLISPFALEEDIHPSYPLGKEWITDFVVENKPPTPFSHTFVEIEPASEPLFIKTRGRADFTARANHAIEQLRDWRIWIRDNIAYVRNDFPSLDHCNFTLIIGRRKGLSAAQRRKIAEINAEHNWRTVLSYDDVADKLKALIANLRIFDKS